MTEEMIFIRALEMAADQRSAFVDAACACDPGLRERIAILLRAHDEPGSFLGNPASMPGGIEPEAGEGPGSLIGPYKLLELIGEGGMGSVYMAEQSAPVRRMVAVKVIKPGMDSRQVLARFEAERQALALMDHPNIARVLDAGTTDRGRPYFVMELVKGIAITRYCDERRLTPRERLELFIAVCRAVQHAHQKGIIHRDLKPSNVLVALYDGRPVPKVIDFGVAKATGRKLTEATLFTGFGTVVGTPEYMSPEQAELNQLDVDTRSDIYSLGVLLYELLTGTTPLDRDRLKQAAMLEMLRVIREEDPQRPSARLSTTQELASIAASRSVDARRLAGLVRGELDWIVMKALEKDRNRRYDTAQGLARDVELHLRDEPISAGPPTAAYRLAKFARRNRGTVLAGSLMLGLLGAGVAETSWGLWRSIREGRAKDEARRETEIHSTRAREIVDRMLTRVGQYLLADVPGMEHARREILEDALAYYREFSRSRGGDASFTIDTALAHQRYGSILAMLGRSNEAIGAFDEALAILTGLSADGEAGARKLEALVETHLSRAAAFEPSTDDAVAGLGSAMEFARRLATAHPTRSGVRRIAWHTIVSYAQAMSHFDRNAALALIEETLSEVDHAEPAERSQLAWSLASASAILESLARRDEAIARIEQAVAIAEDLADSTGDQSARVNLATFLMQRSRFIDSRASKESAVDDARRGVALLEQLTRDYPSTPRLRSSLDFARMVLADVLSKADRRAEAETTYRRLIDDLAARPAPAHPTRRLGQPSLELAALPLITTYAHAFRYSLFDSADDTLARAISAHIHLGLLLDREGRAAEADEIFARIHALLDDADQHAKDDASTRIDLAIANARAAYGFELAKRPRDAEVRNRRSLEMFERADAIVDSSLALREKRASEHYRRGRILGALGRDREASESYRIAADFYEALVDLESDRREAFRYARAACLNNGARSLVKPSGATRVDAEQAERFSLAALDLYPKRGDFLNTLGIVRYRLGDLARAAETLSESMSRRNGGDAADWFPLAIVRLRLGDEPEARRLFTRATEWMERHAPNDPDLIALRDEARAAIHPGSAAKPESPGDLQPLR
ncbi:MAG: protein kinase [Isosphaeraceae bacterium]|nr:protein kinase [Isosphaeraceae bacterium]